MTPPGSPSSGPTRCRRGAARSPGVARPVPRRHRAQPSDEEREAARAHGAEMDRLGAVVAAQQRAARQAREKRAPGQPWTWPRARCGVTYDELAPHLSARARWLAATTRAARSHAARAPACVVLAACTVSARASASVLVVSLASVRDSFTTLGGISATAPQTTVAVAGARGLAIAGWDTRGHRAGGDGLCMPAPVRALRAGAAAATPGSARLAAQVLLGQVPPGVRVRVEERPAHRAPQPGLESVVRRWRRCVCELRRPAALAGARRRRPRPRGHGCRPGDGGAPACACRPGRPRRVVHRR